MLHAFYVLDHPDQAVRSPLLVEESYFFEAGVLSHGEEEVKLTDPNVPFEEKEEYLRAQLEPIIEALGLKKLPDAYEVLIAFCIGFLPAEYRSHYSDLCILGDIRTVLPPQSVIEDMIRAWSSPYNTSCQALKAYLEAKISGN